MKGKGLMSIRGSLDVVTADYASGWAFSPDASGSIALQAMLNEEVIGEAVADIFRGDLAAAGFGSGECGYMIQFHRRIDPLYLPFVVVRPAGGNTELPRWAPTGVVECFNSLFRSHPAAGRHRSVLGGLWTDRSDAVAILGGKLEIGQVTADDGEVLERLVRQGMTVVEDVTELAPASEPDRETIGQVLSGRLLRLLQIVLDDQPVVLKAETGSASRPFTQPSTETELPSPAECLLVVMPLGQSPLQLDLLREGHMLPEFNRDGVSRWARPGVVDIAETDLENLGLLERQEVPPGAVAIIGPGTPHVLHCEAQASALRLLVVPARGLPVRLLQDPARQEAVTAEGVRIWL